MALDPMLHKAVRNGRVRDIIQLLAGGADMDVRSSLGGHVLHVAVSNGRSDMVQFILENGVDVNVKTNGGYSPLHSACSRTRIRGRVDIIRHLLQCGADVSARNAENIPDDDDENGQDNETFFDDGDQGSGGRTPLHYAILYRSIQVVKLLLCHGADISTKEGDGYNALHWAVMIHESEVIREMVRVQRNPLLHANRRGIEKAVKVIQLLLAHGTDVSAKIAHLQATTNRGVTPMQVAYTDDMKKMLQDALLHAEDARRELLEAFTMGQHERLGVVSDILPLAAETVQMIMDRV